MKAYIYFIINDINGKRYVGQTTDFSRRKYTHFKHLRENRHANIKLQNAWNKYGEKNFHIEKIILDNTNKEELDELEKYYISKYNSIENGYNIVEGGSKGRGNNSRGKLNFEEYAIIFLGNIKYKGMTTRTAKIFNIDSSSVSSIIKLKSYLWFQDELKNLSNEEKERFIKIFENITNIENNPPWIIRKTLDEENTFKILCFVSSYGRGAEKFCLEYFGLSKGFIFHFMKGKTRQQIKDKYKQLSKKEIIQIGKQCWIDWGKPNLKEKYQNLQDKYPNLKL